MGATKSEATRRQEFVAAAEGMYVRLRQWRAAHLEASFDEIGNQVWSCRRTGGMLNVIGEGWKEVKMVSVSAVTHPVDAATGECEVALTQHSHRAGLWDAATFAPHPWAEVRRRGVDNAKTIVAPQRWRRLDLGHCLDGFCRARREPGLVACGATALDDRQYATGSKPASGRRNRLKPGWSSRSCACVAQCALAQLLLSGAEFIRHLAP